MKGILEKTTRGWVVKKIEYGSDEAKFITTYPLHESDVSNIDEAVRLGEHGEVEFELVRGYDSVFNTTKPFAKIWYSSDKIKSYLDSFICQMEDCPHCAYEEQERYEAALEKDAAVEFGEWLMVQGIQYVDNTDEGNVYMVESNMNRKMIMEQIYQLYLKSEQ